MTGRPQNMRMHTLDTKVHFWGRRWGVGDAGATMSSTKMTVHLQSLGRALLATQINWLRIAGLYDSLQIILNQWGGLYDSRFFVNIWVNRHC